MPPPCIRIPDASWHVSVSLSACIPGQHRGEAVSNAAVSLKNFLPEAGHSTRKREAHAAGEAHRRHSKKPRRNQPQVPPRRDRPKEDGPGCFLFPRLDHEAAGENPQAGKALSFPDKLLLPHGNGSEAVRPRGSIVQEEDGVEEPAHPTKPNKKKTSSLMSRNVKRKRKRAGAGQDRQDQQGGVSLSLFGMGLLHRLEEQAKQSRKRLAAGTKQKAPAAPNGLPFQPARSTAAGQQRGLYALDDRCIYNFKDTQASACFPRHSAHEACQAGCPPELLRYALFPAGTHSQWQVILDAISKCNANDARRALAQEHLQDEPPAPAAEVNLDHILSCVPYRDLLRDLFGGSTEEARPRSLQAPSVPVVTKSYEESFMREPMWEYERPCVMGANCECNFISARPGEAFTGVEFTLPFEAALDASDRPRQMCVLCHRKLVQSLFYDIMYAGAPFNGVIQRYGNICNHAGEYAREVFPVALTLLADAGEYAREVMLICPPNGPVECMPFPSASHQRNKYTVYSKGGIRYIMQNRMAWEDFCQAPPSSAVP